MKIVGIIAEYNPFHCGHQYHIEKAKTMADADLALVVMSGDYVQRGEPAFVPKHIRARMALLSGADLVLELPVCFAGASAEYFAMGAVSLLEHLGCVDALCFGSECGDLAVLKETAQILASEPDAYKEALQASLKRGLSFPKARMAALETCLPVKAEASESVLNQPNNILAVEYLKALLKLDSAIRPYTVSRIISGYHDRELSDSYSSASAIRNFFAQYRHALPPGREDLLKSLHGQIPDSGIDLLCQCFGRRFPVYADDFSLLLKQRLLQETKQSLQTYLDVSEELANRIKNRENEFLSFTRFCELLHTKETTYTRISRSLLHILLNIRTSDLNACASSGFVRYARVLGFRSESAAILKKISTHADIPLLTKPGRDEILDPLGKKMLDQELYASALYESVITQKYQTPFISEHQKQIVIV